MSKVYAGDQLPDGQASTLESSIVSQCKAFLSDAELRLRVYKVLESPLFSLLLAGLVLLAVFHTSLLVEGIILFFFVLECGTRMWAMGPAQFMTSLLCYLDLFVTCISLFCFVSMQQTNAAGMVMLGRLFRVFKLLRLLKGVRFVRLIRLQFIDVSPGNMACAPPPGTVFALFSNKAFDMSGDGLLSITELKSALRSNQLMVSNHLLGSVFNEIFKVQNQRELLFDHDMYRPITEPEDRTITIGAVEEYVREIRPSTKQERRWRIARRVFTSVNCWSIFGYFIANVIAITGQPVIGLYDPAEQWYLAAVSAFLWCFGGIGYIQLHYANLAHEFDQFEMVQITLAQHFRKVLAVAGPTPTPATTPANTPTKDSQHAVAAAALISPPASPVSTLDAASQARSMTRSLSKATLFESADESLSIDDVRTLLSDKNVHISDAALLHWFKKVDTSGDHLISRREIKQYIITWKPTGRNGKVKAVLSGFSDFTGLCLVLFLVASFIFLGNALLWKGMLDAATKFDLTIFAVYAWFFGILGFIRIGTQSVSNDFEALHSARRSLAVALNDSHAAGQLFKAEDYNSSSAWLERLLGEECDNDELRDWTGLMRTNPYLDNLNYFIAILKHDQQLLSKMTGIPRVVLYRLIEALNWESEKPWIMKEASMDDLKNMLISHHILISEHNVERIYREIDTDNSNSVSMEEFEAFRRGNVKNASQKRWHVVMTRLSDPGFYLQLFSLAGCIFCLGPGHYWPYAGTSLLSTVDSYQISAFLFWIGTFESVRQAVRTVVADVDMQEQARLDFRRSVESASDAQERRAAAAQRLASAKTATKALSAFLAPSSGRALARSTSLHSAPAFSLSPGSNVPDGGPNSHRGSFRDSLAALTSTSQPGAESASTAAVTSSAAPAALDPESIARAARLHGGDEECSPRRDTYPMGENSLVQEGVAMLDTPKPRRRRRSNLGMSVQNVSQEQAAGAAADTGTGGATGVAMEGGVTGGAGGPAPLASPQTVGDLMWR
jgi:Ca2+-binding EF-hand superfamily protein